MTTINFLELLQNNPGKELVFEYQAETYVPKAYHITEVKNLHFDSVDCGGNEHSEDQTIVQLWTNPVEVKSKYMETEKALKILEKVDSIRPMNMNTEIYFEYGNKNIPKSNYSVKNVSVEDDKVVLKMFVEATACKPIQLKTVAAKVASCCGSNNVCC